MKVYITQMLRFGDTESHHYIVGVFTTESKAIYVGEVEKAWRGGTKYEYRVVAENVNEEPPNKHWEDKIKWFQETKLTGCKGVAS